MKEAIVSAGPNVKIQDSPMPTAEADEVVIKIAVSGSNPKDWKYPEWRDQVLNTGDDMAGTVHSVGSNVFEFKPGDRVAAFHVMGSPGGSFAEYGVAPAIATFHLPSKTTFEEGAAIPLAAMTAAIGLFIRLGLPEPWTGTRDEKGRADTGPIVIYGAASAVGAYAIQLAKRAGLGPLICVAGRGIPFVEGLIDQSAGDKIIDYRKGDDAVVEGLKTAVPASTHLMYAFDAVSEKGSYQNICKVLSTSGGKITLVLPGRDYSEIPSGIEQSITYVGDCHKQHADFGSAWFRLMAKGLQEGWFKPHPQEIVKGGLNGVETALKNLKDGKASAVKYVFRLDETS